MKRCPHCYCVYDNSERFCESDGQLLLIDPTLSVIERDEDDDVSIGSNVGVASSRDYWLTGIVGVMVGILVCAGVYAGLSIWSIQNAEDQEPPDYASQTVQPVQSAQTTARLPEALPEPTEEPSPPPDADDASVVQAEPSSQPDEAVAARLNQGPVSTGQRVVDSADASDVRTIIQMNDGTAVEVDAAWQEGQGVWYRRGGLVAFVDSRRVKAITARAAPQPSPVPSQ